MDLSEKTILVEIPAYNDPRLVPTVKSLISQADYPNRIHFAICYQGDDMTDYNKLKDIKNCKIITVSEKNSRGSCFARYLCQLFLDDESFVMHVDSHMTAIKGWDTCILKQWYSLNNPKAIISVYPADDRVLIGKSLDDDVYNIPPKTYCSITAKSFDDDNYFVYFGYNPKLPKMQKTMFVAAGYFFAPAQADKDVLFDKTSAFRGDELPMAIRLWTYGYDVYAPDEVYLYHHYVDKKTGDLRKFPKELPYKSENKMFELLVGVRKGNLPKGYVGQERSVEEYEKISGIDFKNKKLHIQALTGNFFPDTYKKLTTEELKDVLDNISKDPSNYINYELLADSLWINNPSQAYLCYEQALFLCPRDLPNNGYWYLNNKYKDFISINEVRVSPTSIIIVSKSTLNTLKLCIESIKCTMPMKSYEIIVVGNENNVEINEYLDSQEDIIYIKNKKEYDIMESYKMGIENARISNDLLLLSDDTILLNGSMFNLKMNLYSDEKVATSRPLSNKFLKEDISLEELINNSGLLIKRNVYNIIKNYDLNIKEIQKLGYKNEVCYSSSVYHIDKKD